VATDSTGTWRNWLGMIAGLVLFGTAFAYLSDYNWPTGTGNLCLLLFLAANVYVPAKRLRVHYRFSGVQPYFNWLLRWHCWLNVAAFLAAVVHCRLASWANRWLWLSLILMGVLVINGFLMKLKYQPNRVTKGLFFLHTQQVVFLVLIYAMIKGHYVFPWLP
jgi:hypothetical protein